MQSFKFETFQNFQKFWVSEKKLLIKEFPMLGFKNFFEWIPSIFRANLKLKLSYFDGNSQKKLDSMFLLQQIRLLLIFGIGKSILSNNKILCCTSSLLFFLFDTPTFI